MGATLMKSRNEIIRELKLQRREISTHPRLKELLKLYDACIAHHESLWLMEMGVVNKAREPVDFKPLIDAISEENLKNEEDLKKLEECKDCDLKKKVHVKRSPLGYIEREE